MMDKPLVSVIIPAYNTEQFIVDAIASIDRQDYPNIEIIVVDDYSTDNTWKLAIRRLQESPRSTWGVRHQENLGECVTSADGFERATGKYLCRLSSDDMWISDGHITRQVRIMEQYDLDWCYNSVNMTGPSLSKARLEHGYWLPIPHRLCTPFMHIFDNWMLEHPRLAAMVETRRLPVNASTLMIRKSAYDKVQWDKSFKTNCDEVLIQRMLQAGMIGRAIEHMGVFYRLHPGQQTNWTGHLQRVAEVRRRLKHEILQGDHPWWFKLYVKYIGWP